MARIIPFKGFRYDSARVELPDVVAPPYDVISPEQRDFLYERNPYNIVHLTNTKELPGDSPLDKYVRAGIHLEDWIKTGILLQEKQPSFYIYEQRYQYQGEPHLRRGFMALARLEEQESGVILGHEQTLMSAKYDRLNLMKECKANLSPIFALYSQPEKTVDGILAEEAKAPAQNAFVDDNGIQNKLWVVSDQDLIARLTNEISDKRIVIADGHHRYETALIYRHIRRSEKKTFSEEALYNYILMMFINLDSGVTIYPIHRVLFNIPGFDAAELRIRLAEYFDIEKISFNCSTCEEAAENLLKRMEREGDTRHTFGLYLGGSDLELLRSKDNDRLRRLVEDKHCQSFKSLDVAIAQAIILQKIIGVDTGRISREEHVRYTPSEREALESVRRGQAQAALLLNPTKPEQVKAVTYEGEKMPQKSTYFYPKLLSGLVISRFNS